MKAKKTARQRRTGRKPADVSPNIVEQMAGIGCSTQEISVVCGVSRDTIERRFAANLAKGRENAKVKLRRKQFQVAMKGNFTMLIWLGKQMLKQSDKQEVGEPGSFENLGNADIDSRIAQLERELGYAAAMDEAGRVGIAQAGDGTAGSAEQDQHVLPR